MLRCQPGIVSLCTAVNPLRRAGGRGTLAAPSKRVHAAPQVAVERGVAAAQPAGRDDDRRADRVPHPRCAQRESRTEYSCTASVAPGRSSVTEALAVGRPGRPGCAPGRRRGCRRTVRRRRRRRGPRCGCARTAPTTATSWRAPRRSMPAERVDRDDLGVRARRRAARRSTRRCRSPRRAGASRAASREFACGCADIRRCA